MNCKKTLHLIIATIILLTYCGDTFAQRISNYMYGQNAWMPSLITGGELENVLATIEADGTEPFGIIRIGGTQFDDETLTNAEYKALIEDVRSIGAEPLVQIPISENIQYAADLVTYLNVTEELNVKFWCIGNEPDLGWLNKEVDGRLINSADDVAFYFKTRASAMKAVDNSIKIFGPDYSFFVDDVDNPGWRPMSTWQYPLLDNNDHDLWGQDSNGNYYVDYYAFHVYQYIDPDNVERKINTVLPYISTINSTYRDPDNQLGWAITETHITTNNDDETEHDKTWSFYAGQHIARIIGLGMKHGAYTVAPWSIHESSGKRDGAGSFANGAYDLGFFDEGPTYKPRSTYHHEVMLSKKAKRNYLWGYTNNDSLYQVSSYDETGYAVMIMNDNDAAGDYTLRFNYDDQTDDYEIYVDANLAKQYESDINAFETQMVFFDANADYIGKITYNNLDEANGNAPTYTGSTPDRIPVSTWNNGLWVDLYAPAPMNDIEIQDNYSVQVNGSFESNNLSITAGDTLTIESGETVIVNGFLNNQGIVIVESGGSLVTKGTVSGTGFRIIRNTTFDTATGKYSAIGSPVSGSTTSLLGDPVYSYDESAAYGADGSSRFSLVSSPQTMIAGDAYFSASTGEVIFTGTPNTGQIDVALSYNFAADGSNAGYNLISNPYPAAISYEEFVATNVISNPVISGAIYLWDDGGSDTGQRTNADYIIANGIGAASAGSGRSGDWNGFIGSGQGFFVKATSAGTLSFTDEMKVEGYNADSSYFRKTDASSFSIVRLVLENQHTRSAMETLIGRSDLATVGIDPLYDAELIGGLYGVRLYSVIENQPYAIQGVSKNTEALSLGVDLTGKGQEYLLSLKESNEEVSVFLFDQYLNIKTDLSAEKSYTFQSAAGVYNDRFRISFERDEKSNLSFRSEHVEVRGQDILISGFSETFSLTIHDMRGRLLDEKVYQPKDEKITYVMPEHMNGLYVIAITSDIISIKRKVKVRR